MEEMRRKADPWYLLASQIGARDPTSKTKMENDQERHPKSQNQTLISTHMCTYFHAYPCTYIHIYTTNIYIHTYIYITHTHETDLYFSAGVLKYVHRS